MTEKEQKDYLKARAKQLDLTQPFWGDQKVSAAQAIGAMDDYHQAKSWEECKWKYDEDDDKYDTSCGRAFCFMVDTPKENEYYYCPGCGKRIKEDNQ